jgi:hypothetical protein
VQRHRGRMIHVPALDSRWLIRPRLCPAHCGRSQFLCRSFRGKAATARARVSPRESQRSYTGRPPFVAATLPASGHCRTVAKLATQFHETAESQPPAG